MRGTDNAQNKYYEKHMSKTRLAPDFLFEVSWEVCNKVGGIHTVVSTKAQTVTKKFGDRYILIGPDLSHEGVNPEFEEDPNLLRAWRQNVYAEGFRVRVGHWKIKGSPLVVLVDFSSLIPRKDEILAKLWEDYHVDSLSGQWDYIEPVLFGYAAGTAIASYVKTFCTSTETTSRMLMLFRLRTSTPSQRISAALLELTEPMPRMMICPPWSCTLGISPRMADCRSV